MQFNDTTASLIVVQYNYRIVAANTMGTGPWYTIQVCSAALPQQPNAPVVAGATASSLTMLLTPPSVGRRLHGIDPISLSFKV